MVNHLKAGVHLNNVAKFSCFLTEKIFIIKIIWLIWIREVVPACWENHTMLITLCMQNAALFYIK